MNNNNDDDNTTTTNNNLKSHAHHVISDFIQTQVKIISDDKSRTRLFFCSQQQHNCSLIQDLTNILSHGDSEELCLCGPLLSTKAP